MEPLFCVRMVLDEAVLRQYAVRNVQADSGSFRRMRLKTAGLLAAVLFLGLATRNPGRALFTGGIVAVALAAMERKQRSQKGQREKIEQQVGWMKQHLAPGELGAETIYQFLEQEMTWENERVKGVLAYRDMTGVQETDQGFFVSADKTRRLFFWKAAFTAGNSREFRPFLEQRISTKGGNVT